MELVKIWSCTSFAIYNVFFTFELLYTHPDFMLGWYYRNLSATHGRVNYTVPCKPCLRWKVLGVCWDTILSCRKLLLDLTQLRPAKWPLAQIARTRHRCLKLHYVLNEIDDRANCPMICTARWNVLWKSSFPIVWYRACSTAMYAIPILLKSHTLVAKAHAHYMTFGYGSSAHVRMECDNVLFDLNWNITFSNVHTKPLTF